MKTKLLLLLFLANFSIYAQINLVPNQGFEIWTGGVVENWNSANSVNQGYDAVEGLYSVRLSYTTASPKITTIVSLNAGTTYTIKYRYKYISNNFGGSHPIALNISKAGSATTLSSSTFATNNSWTVKETTFTPDSNLAYDLSISTFSFDSAPFDVLIDDVQVYVQGTEQYTLIPDVEFEKVLIDLGVDFGPTDGKVLTNNIKKIKSISVNAKNVSNLTGIQDFEALESLNCSGSSYYSNGTGGDGNITAIDVSKNLNLITLYCSGNKISTIDVSKNTKLTNLYVKGNRLSTLDVSNSPSLKILEFGSNLISTIDISKNLALNRLDLSSTKITSIDVSKLTNLNILSLYSNKFTSLDITKNVNLITLNCNSNLLTSLDVSKNINLVNLNCFSNQLTSLDVSKNLSLVSLPCQENQLTVLDVSKNLALKTLNCSSNKLTSLDVSKNPSLTSLQCSSNNLLSLNLKNGSNTSLTSVNFKENINLPCIAVDNVEYANTNWASNKESNTFFSLFDCSLITEIPDATFEAKLIDLGIDTDGKNGTVLNSSISAITSLNLSGSSISNLKGIEGFTALTSLNVSGNSLTKLDLSKNTAINTLDVSNNASLNCIQVANVETATNWTTTKDAGVNFSLDCNNYTLIPDSKFEDKLIALGIDKDGKNGKVNTESISGITDLDLSTIEISDLTGIEDFTNLTYLKCYGNSTQSPSGGNGKLTKLDLSKNLKLTTLNCRYNQLSTIDLSKNTLLKDVNLSNNKIEAIDISANTALTTFSISGNKLTSIDLSQNTALLYAFFSNNDISAVDFSKNQNLLTADFNGNQLTAVDISKNTALKSALFSNNKLKNIDLSKNTELTSLSIYQADLTSLDISKNVKLQSLQCNSNALTALDVTKNTDLYSLDCNYNKIITLDLSKNLVLNSLSVTGNQLTSLDVSKNVALTSLECYNNKLTSLNLKNGKNSSLSISRISFVNNPTLSCIQVDNVDYSNSNWSQVKDQTAYYSSLDCKLSTNIPDSKFEDKLIALGIDTDGKNGGILNSSINTVTSLDVSNSSITDLSGIQGFTALTNLNVSGNTLTKLDVSKNTALTVLNSSGNSSLSCIQVADMAATSNWTVTKDATTSFNLDCNIYTLILDSVFEDYLISANIDRDGKNGKVKTESIDKITNLDLSGKGISDLTGIQDFKSLVQLYVDRNKLTTIDISKNQSITYVNASSNKITNVDLSKNTALTHINLGDNQLTNIDLSKNVNLVNVLIGNNKITTLDLSKNAKLGYLLAHGNSLVTLDVSNNPELYQLWFQDNSIRTIDLSKNTKIKQVLGSNNKLANLNLKNGANTLIELTSGNNGGLTFIGNPDLTCIQVDNTEYSNLNWSSKKDATTSFSSEACPVVVPYTLIPDSKFEDKLIALGIDKDGKNGKVATMDIVSLTSLNVSNSGITDLTGIQDFSLLTSLECNNNQLTSIDITKNPALTKLNVSNNKLTVLTVSSNLALSNLSLSSNEILVLDVSKNINLTYLSASFNKLRNLDVSKNTKLKEFDCAGNDLYNLNLKNGNNVNMQRVIFGNFTQNPNLLCIQVDDAAFSDANWIAKDATATYSTEICETNYQYTLIPDKNFESRLISMGIDSGTPDGKVRTDYIARVTQLSVLGAPEKITDLTGIQDFISLETLYCYNQALTQIDLSKNTKLKYVDMSSNKITSLDLSNPALETLNCSSNGLTELNVSKITTLKSLTAGTNQLTNVDVSKNTQLTRLYLFSNQLTNIDITNNLALTELVVYSNKLNSIDVSKNSALTTLSAYSNSALTSVDVSKNPVLNILNVSYCQLSSIDVSKNSLLSSLDVSVNKIETLNVSQNPALIAVRAHSNQLTSLNLQNGKNSLLTNVNVSFSSNPKLTCILVDDVAYANTNWSDRKDSTANYNTECTGELVLPSYNFAIETKSESCTGENNGEISIVGRSSYDYAATINDKAYTFTNNSLKVTSLAPGTYQIKVTIPDMIFEQNFTVTIAKAATIAGKSNVASKKVDVEITEGTAPFTVFVDGAEQFQTTDTNFSVELEKAGLVEVATSKACEGILAKKVTSLELGTTLSAYPNPTSGSIEIEIPSAKAEVVIELYNFGGQLVSKGTYNTESGRALLNLENLPSGIYAAKIYLETPEFVKIIKK